MKSYIIMDINKAAYKLVMSNKLFSFAGILLILSSESNNYNMRIKLSLAIIFLILILCTAVIMIIRYELKHKMTTLTESEKLK
jgi:hypothetical protein